MMNDNFLSQEEIDSLLNKGKDVDTKQNIDEDTKDLLGEVGNISMATAATALSTILGKQVKIDTPKVEVSNLKEIMTNLSVPVVVLQVNFSEGLNGNNILSIKIKDASIIANLMMGGDGTEVKEELSEIEMSAISEAMNQMIGSASTAISTLIRRDVNITPPNIQVWDGTKADIPEELSEETQIIKTSFNLTVEGLIDSEIMQIFSMEVVDELVESMTGGYGGQTENNSETESQNDNVVETGEEINEVQQIQEQPKPQAQPEPQMQQQPQPTQQINNNVQQQPQEEVVVQKPQFAPLQVSNGGEQNNLDLILDVPLELSVVLGKTKKSIKEVLALNPGSIVELNKFAEEPLEIYANGKLIAQGEVVVINENFGIRITSIKSTRERVEQLK